MDVDDFDESRAVTRVEMSGEEHPEHAVLAKNARRVKPLQGASEAIKRRDPTAAHNGISWVRASDLINTGTGRIAGRGIDLQAELARRLRRVPATTTREMRERARRLPPLSAFGRVRVHPQISRHGLERS